MKLHSPTYLGSTGQMNAWILHAEINPADAPATTMDFTGLGRYSRLFIIWTRVESDTDNRGLRMQMSLDGGVTFQSGASDYQFAGNGHSTASVNVSDAADSVVDLSEDSAAAFLGTAGGELNYGYMTVYNTNVANTDVKKGQGHYVSTGVGSTTTGHLANVNFSLLIDGPGTIGGVRFLLSNTGDINGGRLRCYGWA